MHLHGRIKVQGKVLLIGESDHGFPVFRSTGQDSEADSPVLIKLGQHLWRPADQIHLSGQNIAFLGSADHALTKFRLHGLCVLQDPHRFIQKNDRPPLRKQVQKALGHRIEIMDETFQSRVDVQFPGLLCDPGDL